MKLLRRLAVLVLFLLTAQSANACERLPVDPEFPAGLDGNYELVGKNPGTGEAYAGYLALSYGETNYALTRVIRDTVVHGEAWIEQCGIDKILLLMARYGTQPVTELFCNLSADSGNYYRITCRTRRAGLQGQGIEAWFQQRDE